MVESQADSGIRSVQIDKPTDRHRQTHMLTEAKTYR